MRCQNHPALNFFNVHATIMSPLPKSQNPTVGFQARFFLEGSHRWQWLGINGLQGKKSQKTEKTRKQMIFF
jgi:hypothetical protein